MYESKKAIPVPLEYWTIVYDSASKEAIGLLGSNDPHSKDIKTYKCKNVCHAIKWLKESLDDFEDETEGHITCCSVASLQKHIEYLENLEARDGTKIIKASKMTEYRVGTNYKK